jgi:hypothetical protein
VGDVTRPPITVIVNWAVSRSRHSGKRTSLAAALRMNTWVLAVPQVILDFELPALPIPADGARQSTPG